MRAPGRGNAAAAPQWFGGGASMIFCCRCKAKKFMKLMLDGGSRGMYELDLCKKCYSEARLRFVISERRL